MHSSCVFHAWILSVYRSAKTFYVSADRIIHKPRTRLSFPRPHPSEKSSFQKKRRNPIRSSLGDPR